MDVLPFIISPCSYPQPPDCGVKLLRTPFLAIVYHCDLGFSILLLAVARMQPTKFRVVFEETKFLF